MIATSPWHVRITQENITFNVSWCKLDIRQHLSQVRHLLGDMLRLKPGSNYTSSLHVFMYYYCLGWYDSDFQVISQRH